MSLPLVATFLDGPWQGTRIDMVVPLTHILLGALGDGAVADRTRSLLRYEIDQMDDYPDRIECRFVLSRDDEEFNAEIAELVELAP